jgi:hypothetical protein
LTGGVRRSELYLEAAAQKRANTDTPQIGGSRVKLPVGTPPSFQLTFDYTSITSIISTHQNTFASITLVITRPVVSYPTLSERLIAGSLFTSITHPAPFCLYVTKPVAL